MPTRRTFTLAGFGAALATAACSVFGSSSVEEVPYTLERSEGAFEIRSYPPVVVARTRSAGDYDDTTDEAFGRLFDYISGANAGESEIAMTAPVYRGAEGGTEIDMTAPVFRAAEGDGWVMEFALPADLTLETAPAPTDPAVEIAERAPVRMAVRRYSGSMGAERFSEESALLLEWVKTQGLRPAGLVRFAGYNPPWTLPAYRRNEVMVPVE